MHVETSVACGSARGGGGVVSRLFSGSGEFRSFDTCLVSRIPRVGGSGGVAAAAFGADEAGEEGRLRGNDGGGEGFSDEFAAAVRGKGRFWSHDGSLRIRHHG